MTEAIDQQRQDTRVNDEANAADDCEFRQPIAQLVSQMACPKNDDTADADNEPVASSSAASLRDAQG